MTTRTVLEEIVTVFTGDAKAYDRVLKHVVGATQVAQKQVQGAIDGIHNSITQSMRAARYQLGSPHGRSHGFQPLSFATVKGGALPSFTRMVTNQNALKFLPFAHVQGGMLPFAGGRMPGRGGGIMGALRSVGGMAARGGGIMSSIVTSTQSAMVSVGQFFHVFNRGIRRMWYDIRMIGQGFRRYFVMPFLAGIGASVYAFAQFDDQIHAAMALFGESGTQIQRQLEDTVLNISKNTRTGPVALAEMLKVLASANYTAADAMKMLGITQEFYVASQMTDAVHSTQLLIDVQSALGLRVANTAQNMKNMVYVGDLLARANELAQVSVEDFAASLVNSGADFRVAGKGAEELLAILAVLGQQGKKGREAGTLASIILRDMQRAALHNRRAWEGIIGKNIVFDQQGGLQNTSEVISALTGRLSGMTDETRAAAIEMLGFRDKSSKATKYLLGNADALKQLQRALQNAGGSMHEMYAERMKAFNSSLQKLWNNLFALGVDIGRTIAADVERLADVIKRVANWFEALPTSTKKFIIYAGFAAIAIGILVGGLISLAASIAAVVSAWPVLVAALGGSAAIVAFLSGIGEVVVIIAAISAAIAGLIYLIGGTEGLRATWDATITAITKGLSIWWAVVRTYFHAWGVLIGGIRSYFKVLFSDFTQMPKFMENLAYNWGVAFGAMHRIAAAFLGWLSMRLQNIFTYDMLIAVGKGIEMAAGMFSKLAYTVAKAMALAMTGNFSGIRNLFSGLIKQMQMIQKDFTSGRETKDLGKTIADILADTQGKFKSLTDGIEFYDPKKKIEEQLSDPLAKANEEINNLKNNSDINFSFGTTGIEAIRAGTTAAFDAVRDHIDYMRNTVPGLADAEASWLGGRPDVTGDTVTEATGETTSAIERGNELLGEILTVLRQNGSATVETINTKPLGLR